MHALDCYTKISKKSHNKPFIISSMRYRNIVDASRIKEKREELEAADQAYLEWQKNAGEALEDKYTGKGVQTLEEKLKKQKDDFAKKSQECNESAKQMEKFKENDEQVRRNKIEKAEKILEKLKPGTRLLHSAALHSEVLRERNVQKSIKNELDKIIREDQERLEKSCISLNNPWIQDTEAQKAEKLSKIKAYKQEVLKTVEDNSKERALQKKRLLDKQRFESEVMDMEIKLQIEKEKLAMDRKRSILRQNAVEAMKMVEQRRQRERLVEEVEERLNCVYNESKQELDKHLKEIKENKLENRTKMIEENAKRLPNADLKQKNHLEVKVAHDLNKMELKFTEAEMERKRKEKAIKQARIEAHLQEVERQKNFQQCCYQQQLFNMGQRFKNDEINISFVQKRAQERRRQQVQFRNMLKEQIDEKERKAKNEEECRLDDPYLQDDQQFFEMARQHIADAKERDRPLYPFIRAIEQYKRDNHIDCVRTLPRHLLSKISIGCRSPTQNPKLSNLTTEKDKTLRECIKTHNILVAGLKEERDRQLSKQLITSGNTLECSKCNAPLKSVQVETNLETDRNARGDGNKISYSMSHLKYINQYKIDNNY